jgi:hypothetical protein
VIAESDPPIVAHVRITNKLDGFGEDGARQTADNNSTQQTTEQHEKPLGGSKWQAEPNCFQSIISAYATVDDPNGPDAGKKGSLPLFG